ncbi:PT domain-containing protein [Burkholderia vietnamiensis]|nr:PT domain-containing protein [Burkholderia vietnamiensis]MCO1350416.1 PT domain-containing protein [Burkholderia vietnamiensis]UQN48104.1 PT domain-containing protein [Burkholderia vietnamiensis]
MTAGTDRDGWDDRDDQRSRNRQPSNRPTVQPSNRPTVQPSNRPTVQPANRPPTPAPNGSLAIPRPAAASRLALPIPRIFPPPIPARSPPFLRKSPVDLRKIAIMQETHNRISKRHWIKKTGFSTMCAIR